MSEERNEYEMTQAELVDGPYRAGTVGGENGMKRRTKGQVA